MSLKEKLYGAYKPLKDKIAELKFGDVADAGKALATRAATRVPVVGAAAVPAAVALDKEKEKQTPQPQIDGETNNQKRFAYVTGYESDEFGNPTTQKTYQERRKIYDELSEDEQQGVVRELLPEGLDFEPERKEVRIKTTQEIEREKNALPSEIDDKIIENLLKGEGLGSSEEHLQAAFEREGAVGPGQHRQIFYDTWNPIFKQKFGRNYDRKNLDDVKKVTKMALEENMKRFGSLEAALIAYNKGASVVQQYIDDPNYTFDDDPYVKGFKERLKQ